MIITKFFLFDGESCEYLYLLKVVVNVFWIKTSIFQFLQILVARLSRHTMISCLKLTEVLKMAKNPVEEGFHNFLIKVLG